VLTWLKIALRNLIKNQRRSLITILAISLGFGSVSLFAGFTEYMYSGNRVVAIYAKAGGHLTIFKRGFLEKGRLDPARYLLYPREIQAVEEIVKGNPHVLLVTPQLYISGLLSNGKISTIFLGSGIVPSALTLFYAQMRMRLSPKFLKALESEGSVMGSKVFGVSVSSGLAHLLELKIGSDAVALATTINGQMNALDVEVEKIVDTGVEAITDKLMGVTFQFAQSLIDTDGADRLAVLLDDLVYTEPVRGLLQRMFLKQGLDLEVKTWEEMSGWYRRVKDLFDVIFAFLFVIVFIIVTMSVINTMSMAVLERTREIGTLRALGIKRRGVQSLFAFESALLGILGSAGGFFLACLGLWLTDVIEPTWIPPGMTRRVPIDIQFVPEAMIFCFFFLLVLCLIASLIPARRAARANIVDALGHV
jgi:putative ABC transport system permease protein